MAGNRESGVPMMFRLRQHIAEHVGKAAKLRGISKTAYITSLIYKDMLEMQRDAREERQTPEEWQAALFKGGTVR